MSNYKQRNPRRQRGNKIHRGPTPGRAGHVVVYAYGDENVERLIKRFNKKVKKEGVLEDYREHEYHKKPSVKKKEKRIRAEKARQRAIRKAAARRNKSNKRSQRGD